MFSKSSESSKIEKGNRPRKAEVLQLGVHFIDDAVIGFIPDDFVLIGAYSGMGKTQLCCNIAQANPSKRVHIFALEAGEFEIERRLKYNIIKRMYYADLTRPTIKDFRYRRWLLGEFDEDLKCYERDAQEEYEFNYRNLHVMYKKNSFDVADLTRSVLEISDHTDMIVIDHAHYFDFGNESDNTALKEIAKTCRTLALEMRKPVVLAAHLRKKDRTNTELIPGIDEFHGSSDLSKIATLVITMSQGSVTADKCFETFFRVAKDRHGGEIIRYVGQEVFNPKIGSYEKGRYKVGWVADQERGEPFKELDREHYPEWGREWGFVPEPVQQSLLSSPVLKGLRNEFTHTLGTGSPAVQEMRGGGA